MLNLNHMPTPLRATVLALAGVAFGFPGMWAQTSHTHQSPTVQAPSASMSPPATLEQLPSKAPTITYENGLLTISADNSTLGDILQRIQIQTGAEVDIPPGADERVVTHLGPGPAGDVIRSLLTGSHFNYIIVGSNGSSALTKILLFPVSAAPTAPPLSSTADNTGRATPPRPDSNEVAESYSPPENSQEPLPHARAMQGIMQQRQQRVMESLQQIRQPN